MDLSLIMLEFFSLTYIAQLCVTISTHNEGYYLFLVIIYFSMHFPIPPSTHLQQLIRILHTHTSRNFNLDFLVCLVFLSTLYYLCVKAIAGP